MRRIFTQTLVLHQCCSSHKINNLTIRWRHHLARVGRDSKPRYIGREFKNTCFTRCSILVYAINRSFLMFVSTALSSQFATGPCQFDVCCVDFDFWCSEPLCCQPIHTSADWHVQHPGWVPRCAVSVLRCNMTDAVQVTCCSSFDGTLKLLRTRTGIE